MSISNRYGWTLRYLKVVNNIVTDRTGLITNMQVWAGLLVASPAEWISGLSLKTGTGAGFSTSLVQMSLTRKWERTLWLKASLLTNTLLDLSVLSVLQVCRDILSLSKITLKLWLTAHFGGKRNPRLFGAVAPVIIYFLSWLDLKKRAQYPHIRILLFYYFSHLPLNNLYTPCSWNVQIDAPF